MSSSSIPQKVMKPLMGDVLNFPHPLHPALVHFPLTFFTAAFTIDSLQLLHTPIATHLLPYALSTGLTLKGGLFEAAWWMHVAALVTSLPAVATGYAEYFAMNSESPASSTATLHAITNMLLWTISAWTVWARFDIPSLPPSDLHALVGAVAFTLTGFSGYLGGSLVYKYGTGIQRQGSALAVKARQERGEEVAPQAGGGVRGVSGGELRKRS